MDCPAPVSTNLRLKNFTVRERKIVLLLRQIVLGEEGELCRAAGSNGERASAGAAGGNEKIETIAVGELVGLGAALGVSDGNSG
jgi:hypothetical protein